MAHRMGSHSSTHGIPYKVLVRVLYTCNTRYNSFVISYEGLFPHVSFLWMGYVTLVFGGYIDTSWSCTRHENIFFVRIVYRVNMHVVQNIAQLFSFFEIMSFLNYGVQHNTIQINN